MNYPLKDYQEEAVDAILHFLRDARARYHRPEPELSQFSLAASTGAGKTVIMAEVIEALFYPNEFGTPRDSRPVVIWFSDDPSLNLQSLKRLESASARLDERGPSKNLVTLDATFKASRLSTGKVYFLNHQKLAKNSTMTRPSEDRPVTIFEAIRNTIQQPNTTVYLVLDEAHKGMGVTPRERQARASLIHQLIDGRSTGIPMPIVIGMSATISRFEKAMAGAGDRANIGTHEVDQAKVQAAGLQKDSLILATSEARGAAFDSNLLSAATRRLREVDDLWRSYTERQGIRPVTPLLLVQVPDKVPADDLASAVRAVRSVWPEVSERAFAHVFDTHSPMSAEGISIRYVHPHSVQEDQSIRVLFAKDAVNTGWDCPRAEVLVSFRPRRDRTAITQILGRLVRNPLAIRIDGHDALNSVVCYLTNFDEDTASAVADAFNDARYGDSDDSDDDAGRGDKRVLVDRATMLPVESGMEDVWEKFENLHSLPAPRRGTAVRRLNALAYNLSYDRIRSGAWHEAQSRLHRYLDDQASARAAEIEQARGRLHQVELTYHTINLDGRSQTMESVLVPADAETIERRREKADEEFTADLVLSYVNHLTGEGASEEDRREAALRVTAMANVRDIKVGLFDLAASLSDEWFDQHDDVIRGLNSLRTGEYDEVRRMASTPRQQRLERPTQWQVNTAWERDGKRVPIPTRSDHLMAGEDGTFPCEFTTLEQAVVKTELGRSGAKAWYRNPSRNEASALGIAYQRDDEWKTMYPDFVFFRATETGEVTASIVDPHTGSLSDAMPKLRGLADYAEKFADAFEHVWSVDSVDGRRRYLDLLDPDVRTAICGEADAVTLFRKFGEDYA